MLGTLGLLFMRRPDLRPHLAVVAKTALAIAAGWGAAELSGLPALPAAIVAALVYAGARARHPRRAGRAARPLIPRR